MAWERPGLHQVVSEREYFVEESLFLLNEYSPELKCVSGLQKRKEDEITQDLKGKMISDLKFMN